MASSQVETAFVRSKLGCVLRDRNRRHNDADDDVVLKKKLKGEANSVEISEDRVGSWIGNKPKKKNRSRLGSPEKPRTRKGDNLVGASSLVQIWEARLNHSKGGNSPINGRSTEDSFQEIHLPAPFLDGESESENESKIPDLIMVETGSNNPDLMVGIESGTLNPASDPGDSKWGRVSEMIRRMSNDKKPTAGDNVGAIDKPIVKTLMTEKSTVPVVTCSPRLRGRQALFDLLKHLERDRNLELKWLLERNAVSRFPQRGRLQSMLRLRTLKRSLVIQDRHQSTTKTPDLNHFESGSPVMRLRAKFQANAANAAAEAERRKGQQSTFGIERSTRSMQHKATSIVQETSSKERLNPQPRRMEEEMLCKKEIPSNMSSLQVQETTVSEALKRKSDHTGLETSVTHQEPQILEHAEASMGESGTYPEIFCVMQGTRETEYLGKQETSFLMQEETSFENRWEEQEEYEDGQSYYGEMSYDWFTEISRPRSYWEDLRKSRYQEVINTRSDEDDICRLLERKTVSDFLQSGLREKIDKLIMSRVHKHAVQRIEEAYKEEEKCDIGEEDDLSQTSSQIFAASPAGSWSCQDTGVPSTPEILSPQHNIHSTEMETVSDLRSQILQLQAEMSELRDSVKMCLDVNASLQKSVHQENPLKRKCCICNETQVETLLYRCGHMCTCLRCANELHWNGGKCPICHAKILDVVRVFVDSRT